LSCSRNDQRPHPTICNGGTTLPIIIMLSTTSQNEEPYHYDGKKKVVDVYVVDDDDDVDDKKEEENERETQQQQQQQQHQHEYEYTAMSLDVAYKALEEIRKLNIQIEFGGIEIDHDKQCIACLRKETQIQLKEENQQNQKTKQKVEQLIASAMNNNSNNNSNSNSNIRSSGNCSSFKKWISDKRKQRIQMHANPCLTCGTPVCKQHRSTTIFTRQFTGSDDLTICMDCIVFFDSQTIIDQLLLSSSSNIIDTKSNNTSGKDDDTTQSSSNQQQQQQQSLLLFINRLLEVYDRTLLLFQYSSSFWSDITANLEGNTTRHNYMELGSSATGVVAGGLGVVAACALLTPVGPPLLIASVLFGGSATVASAGSEAVNSSSEPNKMADRILAMFLLVKTISELPTTLTELRAKMIEEIIMDDVQLQQQQQQQDDTKNDDEEHPSNDEDDQYKNPTDNIATVPNNNNGRIISTGLVGRISTSADSITTEGGNNTTTTTSKIMPSVHVTRTITNVVKPLTGGVFSAVSIFTEAREFGKTVTKIQAGSPCEKAEQIRSISFDQIPRTDDLAPMINTTLNLYQQIIPTYISYQNRRKETQQLLLDSAIEAGIITDLIIDDVNDSAADNNNNNNTVLRRPLGWRFRSRSQQQASGSNLISTAAIEADADTDADAIKGEGEGTAEQKSSSSSFIRSINNHNTGDFVRAATNAASSEEQEQRKFGWRIKRALNRE